MSTTTRRAVLWGGFGAAVLGFGAHSAMAAESVVITPMNCGIMVTNNLDVDVNVEVLRGDNTVATVTVPAGATVPVDLSGQFDGQPAIEFGGAWSAPSTGLTGGTTTYVVNCTPTEPPPEPEPEDPKGPPPTAGPPPGVGNPNAGPPPHAGTGRPPANPGKGKGKGRGRNKP